MRNPNTDAIPYTAHVSYRYDGELEFLILTVNAVSEQQAIKLARAEAGNILEEGIRFRVAIEPNERTQQWAPLYCVFRNSERRELDAELSYGEDPRADVVSINSYLERVGRWDDLRALQVRKDAEGELIALWNQRVYTYS